MKDHSATVLADGFVFLEGPRWHQDRLWLSDLFGCKVYTVGLDGTKTLVRDVPQRPSGIGFLKDGTPLVSSMRDRKVLKLVDGDWEVYADLGEMANGDVNDLLVDDMDRVYIGNFGYDIHGGAPKAVTDMHLIEADGSIRVAATGLDFPNGTVIFNGGRTLVVAETWSAKLTAFDRSDDGSLSNRRLFADLEGREPDGICVDAQGGIWASCFNTGEFIRVLDGGTITDRVKCGQRAVACALGGREGKTLFCAAYQGTMEDIEQGKPLAAVFTVDVDIPAPNSVHNRFSAN